MARNRTALICIAPGGALFDAAEVRAHLRVDFDDDDDLIDALCETATALLDGADGWLKRSLKAQSWRLVLPRFDAGCYVHRPDVRGDRIDLPLPPCASVETISYVDPSGTVQQLPSEAWYLVDCGTEESYVIPAPGTSWPATGGVPDAVKIEFNSGYAQDIVPRPIRQAALLMIGDWYAARETFVTGTVSQEIKMSAAVAALIANYRIVRF